MSKFFLFLVLSLALHFSADKVGAQQFNGQIVVGYPYDTREYGTDRISRDRTKGKPHGTWRREATDFRIPAGGKVIAVADGDVVFIQNSAPDGRPASISADWYSGIEKDDPSVGLGTMGNFVTIRHQQDGIIFYASYLHLQQNSVAVGLNARVRKGQTLGLVGLTGLRTGPHLHFQAGLQTVPKGPGGLVSDFFVGKIADASKRDQALLVFSATEETSEPPEATQDDLTKFVQMLAGDYESQPLNCLIQAEERRYGTYLRIGTRQNAFLHNGEYETEGGGCELSEAKWQGKDSVDVLGICGAEEERSAALSKRRLLLFDNASKVVVISRQDAVMYHRCAPIVSGSFKCTVIDGQTNAITDQNTCRNRITVLPDRSVEHLFTWPSGARTTLTGYSYSIAAAAQINGQPATQVSDAIGVEQGACVRNQSSGNVFCAVPYFDEDAAVINAASLEQSASAQQQSNDAFHCRVSSFRIGEAPVIFDDEPCTRVERVAQQGRYVLDFIWPSGAKTVVESKDASVGNAYRINGQEAGLTNAMGDGDGYSDCSFNFVTSKMFCYVDKAQEAKYGGVPSVQATNSGAGQGIDLAGTKWLKQSGKLRLEFRNRISVVPVTIQKASSAGGFTIPGVATSYDPEEYVINGGEIIFDVAGFGGQHRTLCKYTNNGRQMTLAQCSDRSRDGVYFRQ